MNDIIPLGGPSRHRAGDRGRAHPVPQSQETNKKHAHTLKPLTPLLQCTPPHKTSVSERRNVPVRKVQFNNNNHHLNNDGSCQSAGKKDAPLQKQGSYDEQKEFALAFCKQLNENLKVTKRKIFISAELYLSLLCLLVVPCFPSSFVFLREDHKL